MTLPAQLTRTLTLNYCCLLDTPPAMRLHTVYKNMCLMHSWRIGVLNNYSCLVLRRTQTSKTLAIRRLAVWETGVSWYHGGLNWGPLRNLFTSQHYPAAAVADHTNNLTFHSRVDSCSVVGLLICERKLSNLFQIIIVWLLNRKCKNLLWVRGSCILIFQFIECMIIIYTLLNV